MYAAGVSNSGCIDASEFARERHRLAAASERVNDFETLAVEV